MKTNHLLAFFACVGLLGSCKEDLDDFNSEAACQDYCEKKAACNDDEPTSDETNVCVDDCRDSIENNCGNENQAAANDKLEECVDKGCTEFWTCMVFDTAPECFGFVSQ